jgi:hypothetical protein
MSRKCGSGALKAKGFELGNGLFEGIQSGEVVGMKGGGVSVVDREDVKAKMSLWFVRRRRRF